MDEDEIIAALEQCDPNLCNIVLYHGSKTMPCPYKKSRSDTEHHTLECQDELMQDAADLIKAYKQELEDKENEIHDIVHDLNNGD